MTLRTILALTGSVLLGLSLGRAAEVPQAPSAATGSAADVGELTDGKLPISEGMPQVHLPQAQRAQLENGLQVLVLEDSDALPTFTAQMVFTDGGGLYEPPDRRGLAGFTAEMLREGTALRSSEAVSRELETLGVTLETKASLASAMATVTVSGLTTRLKPALELLDDLVRHPAFREPQVAQHASLALADLELQRARPEFVSQEQLLKAIYQRHPAALSVAPVKAIKAINSADLERFHTLHYRPNGALLIVVGAVTVDRIVAEARRLFGDWTSQETPATAIAAVPAPRAPSIRLVDRPGSVQTVIQLGTLGIDRTDPDYFPLLVMTEIMGGQAWSRLYQNLRERNGYTYGAYSGFTAAKIPGVWQITTSVRTEVTQSALKELFGELQRMRQEPVSPAELANSKRALVGKFIFSLERPESLLDDALTQTLYDLPPDYWNTYPERVAAVSAQDVERVAQRVLAPERMQLATVGDAQKIRPVLAQYGPVQDGDADAATPGQIGRNFLPSEHSRFGPTVQEIADTLVGRAVTTRAGITWKVVTGEGKPQDNLNFYTGSPGICYFLLKAYQALGTLDYRQAAERGMQDILSRAHKDRHGLFFDETHNGVFEGNAGPGYLFLYAYHVTSNKRQLATAEAIARRIVAVPNVEMKSSPDIISGAAGTGLFLLAMHATTGNPLYLQGARRLGDFLSERAERRVDGVTWKLVALPGSSQAEYYFVGFSHGPAGIAYYLDRLYRVTADERYLLLADQAMDHIGAIALREKGYVKWYHEELKRSTRFSSQWCHGAPGMNPFFLELYAREGDRQFLDWATTSTRYLLDQGVNIRENPSVCHGVSGNTASLYMMYRITGNPEYLVTVRAAVDFLYSTMRHGPQGVWWDAPTYDKDYRQDDSYMTGLAGIGDFFVLLYTDGKLNMFGPLGYGDDLPSEPGTVRHSNSG